MSSLKNSLEVELNAKIKELTEIKLLLTRSSLAEKQKNILIKNTVPIAYATWEGYVKFAFREYITEINQMNLGKSNISPQILAHSLDVKFNQLTTGMTGFKKKLGFSEELLKFLDANIVIETKLPTQNNINFKVINEILERFNLEKLPEKPYKNQLNQLLKFRNRLAHREYTAIQLNNVLIQINNVNLLMDEVMLKIIDGFTKKTFLKQ